MSSGNRVLYIFATLALVQQIYAATTYNLSASDTTEVPITSTTSVIFPPVKSAFAQVAVANSSLPSYQDPTVSAPGQFANVSIFIAVYDSKTRLTTQPTSPIWIKIVDEQLTADYQLYLWNSVVQKWYSAVNTCTNATASLTNDTLLVPVCHVGQLALFDMSIDETSGGGALIDQTTSPKPSKAGVIAAAVIVPIVVVIIVIVLVYMFMIRYRQRSKSNADLEKSVRPIPQLTTTVVKTNEEEEVDSYSSNSSASSVSSYSESSHSEGEEKQKAPVVVVESHPQVAEEKKEEPKPTVPTTEDKPEEDEKDESSSASSSSSSSSSSSDSDSDSSSSDSD